ncbi:competence type IV pilus major pilin ComGC [Bacillus songklensis]|uniref:ComG operon protein 3 n=1 Tax=Bacillus songklensis TaxID=1069116 RepID=A0ABV8B162_9BACI
MRRQLVKKNGFTLIEMLVVMLVISILLLITVPNLLKNNGAINDKGCEAYIKTVQAQVEVYKIENENKIPTLDQLKTDGYIKETKCPNGDGIEIVNGEVKESDTATTATTS